ncbi:low temperature requirement protein A [Nocardia sp. CA-135398]|uniref:low temperature requirement protein A n=1 Tax=Nocardia sp. CA-135398 TaxID=3239977 RepID=UPI003D9908BA
MDKVTPSADTQPHERHATWMELFFDLVAVAGIGQLTHLLHRGPTLLHAALYLLLYLAFWMAWACITVYGNIARDQTRLPLMLSAMLGLGVMAAAVAGIPDRHATAFAAVYVLVRIATSQVWGRGWVIVDWPVTQLGGGVLPWVVSLWVAEPWKYWLWALGLAVDMWSMFAVNGEQILIAAQRRFDGRLRRSKRFDDVELPKIQALHADPAHLGERLGLYVIIVLGEGVIAVSSAVSGVAWTPTLGVVGIGGFAILVGMWALTLMHGFVPRLMAGEVPPEVLPRQRIMALHCVVTGAIATVAAGLGLVAEHPQGHLSAGVGWVLCGGAAVFFAILGIGGVVGPARWRWLLSWPVPCLVIVVVLGAFGPHVGAVGLVCSIVVLVGWAVFWEYQVSGRHLEAAAD